MIKFKCILYCSGEDRIKSESDSMNKYIVKNDIVYRIAVKRLLSYKF